MAGFSSELRGLARSLRDNLQRFVLPEARPTGQSLGTGSYGSVEEVEVKGMICAGKKIHEALLDAGNFGVQVIARKYAEECQLMTEMRHPHVVQFIGICFRAESPLPLLVMERLEMSLDDLLETTPDIPLTIKRSVLEGTARGLLYLHHRDPPVIHRDLTAKNVLLTSYFEAKITDFGNSRMVEFQPGRLGSLSQLPGTLVYMPPEALEDRPRYGPSLDVFSFGHCALFTCTQVFPGALKSSTYPDPANAERILARSEIQRREDFLSKLEQLLAGGSRHPMVALIRQCLHNTPDRRPNTQGLVEQLVGMKAAIEGPYGDMVAKLDVARVGMSRSRDMQVRELQQRVAQLEANIDARGKGQIAELRAEVTTLQRQVREKDREHSEEIREKNDQIRTKDGQIQAKDEEISSKNDQLRASAAELQQLRISCDSLTAENVELLSKQPASGGGGSWLPRFGSCTSCTELQKKVDQLQEEKSRLVTEMNAEMQITQGDCGESKETIIKQYEIFFTQEADNLNKQLRSFSKLEGRVKLCESFERVHDAIQHQIILYVQEAILQLFQLSASDRKLPLKDLSRAYARLLVSQNLTLQCPPEFEKQIIACESENRLPDSTIRKAIALSWKLATAVPPMIPLPSTQYPGFDERIHDQTAGGSKKNIHPGGRITYVRPVLLASCNADSVMAKGLVANA